MGVLKESEEKMKAIEEAGRRYEDYVIRMRREFHRHPEPSMQEYETAKRILTELRAMGIAGRIVQGIGVIAELKGGRPGKCVALRADMDALTAFEETGLPFASEAEGVSHACGHDAHMAMILGAAKILSETRDEVPGIVRFIFQPAEEIATGADIMIAAGAMDGVDSIFGMHVWGSLENGKFSIESGPRMAAADFFTIDIEGVSCHGAEPGKGIDAIIAGAQLVNGFQTIISREVDPLEPAVITIGEFHAGTADNVIAGEAHLTGTTRAYTSELRARLKDSMQRVIDGTAQTYRTGIKIHYHSCSEPLINDPGCTEIAARAADKLFGEESRAHLEKVSPGEDFSHYMKYAPGCFVFVGTYDEEKGLVYDNHSSCFDIDESILIRGAMLAAQYVFEFSE